MSLLPLEFAKYTKAKGKLFLASVPALVSTYLGKNVLDFIHMKKGSDGENINVLVCLYLWIWDGFSTLLHKRIGTTDPIYTRD